MQISEYSGFGRTLTVEFMCARCKVTASRPLRDSLPHNEPVRNLSDLIPPNGWRNGGFYYPTFCPECAEKYDRFMSGGMKSDDE